MLLAGRFRPFLVVSVHRFAEDTGTFGPLRQQRGQLAAQPVQLDAGGRMDGDRLDRVAGGLAEGAEDRRERLCRPEDPEVARPGGVVLDRHLARSRPAAAPRPPSRRRPAPTRAPHSGQKRLPFGSAEPQFSQLAAGMHLLPAGAPGRAPAAPRPRGGAAARPGRGSRRRRPSPCGGRTRAPSAPPARGHAPPRGRSAPARPRQAGSRRSSARPRVAEERRAPRAARTRRRAARRARATSALRGRVLRRALRHERVGLATKAPCA